MTLGPPEDLLRSAMFEHLRRLTARHPDGIPSAEINKFMFDGRAMPLVVQPGIWKPRGLSAALTIRTTFSREPGAAPYEDEIGPDGMVRYKWRGTDPEHSDNRALREAMRDHTPLAYFVGVARGVYHAIYPAFLVAEEPERHQFVVQVDPAQWVTGDSVVPDVRDYAERLTRLRLHQPVFRARVLRAYDSACAMCRLRHVQLLDAAHILPDGHPRGEPVLPNGIALCKIHHAAYDSDILGIRPDLVIEVNTEVLHERDGPMLRHGLQALHRSTIVVPRSTRDRPDPVRLGERYEQFRRAA
jgi:putative restriction endonuclease